MMIDDVWPRSRHHRRNDLLLRQVAADVGVARQLAWLVLRYGRVEHISVTPFDIDRVVLHSARLQRLFWTFFFAFIIERAIIELKKRR
jgi:hypothetical protein